MLKAKGGQIEESLVALLQVFLADLGRVVAQKVYMTANVQKDFSNQGLSLEFQHRNISLSVVRLFAFDFTDLLNPFLFLSGQLSVRIRQPN